MDTPADEVAADGKCSLREAVQAANANTAQDSCPAGDPGADLIAVPAGTYVLALGQLDITESVTISGDPEGGTTVDGGRASRVFSIGSDSFVGPAALTLNDLTVQNGVGGLEGAGVRMELAPYWPAGNLVTTLNRVVVQDNAGTGVLACGGVLYLNECTVQRNTSDGRGGGIALGCGDRGTTGHVARSTIRGNTAHDIGGGIAQHVAPSYLAVTDSTIRDNTAYGFGGGIQSYGNLDVSGTTISGNRSLNGSRVGAAGGGILHTFGTLNLTNSTISGNSSAGGGGGLDLGNSNGSAALNNVTITANSAGGAESGQPLGGGGVLARSGEPTGNGPVYVKNSIIAGNTDLAGSPDCANTLVSQGYVLIGDGSGCTLAGSATGNLVGTAAAPVDARLAPLADNGGPSWTHALCQAAGDPDSTCVWRSPALDAANPAAAGSDGDACLPHDQRGVERPLDGDGNGEAICDMGAVEAPTFVANTKPELSITAPVSRQEFAALASVGLTGTITDPDAGDTWTCTIGWGDGSTTSATVVGSSVAGSHAFAGAGFFTILLTCADQAGAWDSASVVVIVYDPNAGSVVGGGVVASPAGACLPGTHSPCDGSDAGAASFRLGAQYRKATPIPVGQNQFRFPAGDLNFRIQSIDWLLVSGCYAQTAGIGTLNGTAGYWFKASARDGNSCPAAALDGFRMQIYFGAPGDESVLVYDNGTGGSGFTPPSTYPSVPDLQSGTLTLRPAAGATRK